jgi:hypothetical protein
MARPSGISSHRKGVSLREEYGEEKAKDISSKIRNKTIEQMRQSGGYWLGKKRDEQTNLKIGNANKGKSHPCSIKQKIQISLANSGEKEFKGFKHTLNSSIRDSQKYRDWRLFVFARDKFTCQKCNKVGTWFEAHHIKSFSYLLKENNIETLEQALRCSNLWSIENGITLCLDCHIKVDSKRRQFKKTR